jgi:hypothetical protein
MRRKIGHRVLRQAGSPPTAHRKRRVVRSSYERFNKVEIRDWIERTCDSMSFFSAPGSMSACVGCGSCDASTGSGITGALSTAVR